MVVLRYVETLTSAIPALVDQATTWQVMDIDVMVRLYNCNYLHDFSEDVY